MAQKIQGETIDRATVVAAFHKWGREHPLHSDRYIKLPAGIRRMISDGIEEMLHMDGQWLTTWYFWNHHRYMGLLDRDRRMGRELLHRFLEELNDGKVPLGETPPIQQ